MRDAPPIPAVPAATPLDTTQIYPFGHPDSSSRIDSSRHWIAGIMLGMPSYAVRAQLGNPRDSTLPELSEMLGVDVFEWRYEGLRVTFAGDSVYGVQCRAATCVTRDSVRVGSSRAAVQATYGRGFRGYSTQADVLMYFRERVACWLLFSFESGAVAEMALACDDS